jgi:hypothetical protein
VRGRVGEGGASGGQGVVTCVGLGRSGGGWN